MLLPCQTINSRDHGKVILRGSHADIPAHEMLKMFFYNPEDCERLAEALLNQP
jgi:hypothetical protein